MGVLGMGIGHSIAVAFEGVHEGDISIGERGELIALI